MNTRQALSAYKQVGVQSGVTDASPHQLISMLLDGAMDRIASAKGAMERRDTGRQGELIGKAITIIDNLRVSLDHEQSPELAGRLSDLYEYMQGRLLEASAASDTAALTEVRDLLATIRDGWESFPAELRRPAG